MSPTDAHTGIPSFPEEPARRLSPTRCLAALVVVAVVAYGAFWGVAKKVDGTTHDSSDQTWFAPYVDATLTPSYPFQASSSNPSRQTVLGFVVASRESGCTPSWGAAYSLAQADQVLSIRSRIAELSEEGVQPIVSFGGQTNTDLAVACTKVSDLESAYQAVVDDYDLSTIDLDVEGSGLASEAANVRRAEAIRDLQVAQSARHHPLSVWLTLPVEPDGLQDNAISVIDALLAARVEVAGVNVMTMDFDHLSSPVSMLPEVENAIRSAEPQVVEQFHRYGVDLSATSGWRHLGATVMIGQNDVAGQRFTVTDAGGLVRFARNHLLGRLSMWSLNRDSQCGSVYSRTGTHSNTCSGTPEKNLQFSTIFGALSGSVSNDSRTEVPPSPDTKVADAPYPIWSPTTSYQQDYKVVLGGYIYQAKWYNTGQSPATQVQYGWETPWELLGPVVAGSSTATTTLPAGTHPTWSGSRSYLLDDEVLYQGLPYQARWDNKDVAPQESDPAGSPWKPLFTIPGEPATTG